MCTSQPASKDESWTLGLLGLMSGRQEFDRLEVPRAEETEVAPVQGREFRFAETFHDRQHGGIDEPDVRIGIPVTELANPRRVLAHDVGNDVGSRQISASRATSTPGFR